MEGFNSELSIIRHVNDDDHYDDQEKQSILPPPPPLNKIKKSPGDRSSRYATVHDSTITVARGWEGWGLLYLNSALIRSLIGTTELVYRFEILLVWSMKEEWSTYGFVYVQ